MSSARPIRRGLHLALNTFCVALFLFPIAWMMLGAFKNEATLLAGEFTVFFEPTFEHWAYIFEHWSVPRHLANSLVIATGATVFTIALGVPAAYGFSRFPIWRKDAVILDLLTLKMIPPIAAAVPLFMLARSTGLYNTLTVLILLNTAFQLPFVILVMKSFIDDIPRDIDEAAQVDGCSPLRTFFKVILPLATPGLICCTMFVFIFTWNEFLFANVMVGGELRPLPVVAGLALTHRGILWGPALALGTVVMVPVLILTFALSRYMARGLTFGAVKG